MHVQGRPICEPVPCRHPHDCGRGPGHPWTLNPRNSCAGADPHITSRRQRRPSIGSRTTSRPRGCARGRDAGGGPRPAARAAGGSPARRCAARARSGAPTSSRIASATGSGRWIQSASGPSGRRPSTRTTWPGTPTTVALGGTLVTTTEPAPIRACRRSRSAPMQLRAGADRDAVAERGVALVRCMLVPPSVTPCRVWQSSPISAVSPMTTPMP